MNVLVERNKEKMVNCLHPIYTWNRLYKISFLRNNSIRCIPHDLHEDVYFTFQVAIKAKTYSVIPDVTYLYRNNEVTGHSWTKKKFDQLAEIFTGQLAVVNAEPLNKKMRLKYKKEAFWLRVNLSRSALVTPGCKRPYINDFLSDIYLKDKDTFRDGILFLGYCVAKMPLIGKIVFIDFRRLYLKIRRIIYKV
jgi:hypothetical protein